MLGKINDVKVGKNTPKQKDVINDYEDLYNTREKVLDFFIDYTKMVFFDAGYKTKHSKWFEILTPKQMFERLPIAFAQLKAGNNSEGLINEIKKIVYFFYQCKEITKKVYNNIIKSIQTQKIDIIFMNSENIKISESHVLILNLTDKLDLRRGEKGIVLLNLSVYYTWKSHKKLIQ